MRLTSEPNNIESYNFDEKMNEAYKSYIKSLAESEKNEVFFNSSPEHASWVLATIFNNAKDYVKIYADSLTGEVSKDSDYQKNLRRFLNNGGILNIVLENHNDDTPINIAEIIHDFQPNKKSQIQVKVHDKRLKYTDNTGIKRPLNFCVADGKMYRFETDIEKKLAICNFKDAKFSKKLKDTFDSIFNGENVREL